MTMVTATPAKSQSLTSMNNPCCSSALLHMVHSQQQQCSNNKKKAKRAVACTESQACCSTDTWIDMTHKNGNLLFVFVDVHVCWWDWSCPNQSFSDCGMLQSTKCCSSAPKSAPMSCVRQNKCQKDLMSSRCHSLWNVSLQSEL